MYYRLSDNDCGVAKLKCNISHRSRFEDDRTILTTKLLNYVTEKFRFYFKYLQKYNPNKHNSYVIVK